MVKWARQMSTEVSLPAWLPPTLREIVIYEITKTYWQSPFNRLAWGVGKEYWREPFTMHGKNTVQLGHLISLVAKIVIRYDDRQEF